MEDRCVCCGDIVPEGRMVCPQCEMGCNEKTSSKLSEVEQTKKPKKTKLIVAELRVLAMTLQSKHFRNLLNEAAQRLEDTDKIARFYRNTTEKLGGDRSGRERRKLCILPILFRSKQHGTAQDSDNQMRGG